VALIAFFVPSMLCLGDRKSIGPVESSLQQFPKVHSVDQPKKPKVVQTVVAVFVFLSCCCCCFCYIDDPSLCHVFWQNAAVSTLSNNLQYIEIFLVNLLFVAICAVQMRV